jgi:aspartate/methionine/tyrosine aminotransferase
MLRDALARFFNERFQPWKGVSVEHLMAGAGLLPVIAQLGRALVDPGNGILLTSPYYHGFDFALTSQHNIKLVGVPVPLDDLCTLRELDHFATYLQESEARGTKIQAVLLCNPQNPYGRCYPLEVLAEYCRFCEKHDLHLISDEIYALSTFSSQDVPNPEPFRSIISLDLDSFGVTESRIHMIYGMSKDFDANGFRAGVLFTRNEQLFQSLLATSIFMLVSSPTAGLWSALLNDQDALGAYVERNREALRGAYERITSWLRFHGISYLPSAAGHFLMVDLRSKLLTQLEAYGSMVGITEDQSMVERERTLQVYLATQCKVVLGPGSAFHMFEGGWFRFTFSISRLAMDTALHRIERGLGWERCPELN